MRAAEKGVDGADDTLVGVEALLEIQPGKRVRAGRPGGELGSARLNHEPFLPIAHAMTTSMPVMVTCALCGAASQQEVLSSTSVLGANDLDGRPNGPARWALEFGVQCCPGCGYCAVDVGELRTNAGRAVADAAYADVLKNSGMPALARHYYCAALVAEAAGESDRAARHYIEAAWACDDAEATERGRACRLRAAEMMAAAFESGQAADSPVSHGVRADLLRRAGLFEEALAAVEDAEAVLPEDFSPHSLQTWVVLTYIRELAGAEDDEPHTIEDAFSTS